MQSSRPVERVQCTTAYTGWPLDVQLGNATTEWTKFNSQFFVSFLIYPHVFVSCFMFVLYMFVSYSIFIYYSFISCCMFVSCYTSVLLHICILLHVSIWLHVCLATYLNLATCLYFTTFVLLHIVCPDRTTSLYLPRILHVYLATCLFSLWSPTPCQCRSPTSVFTLHCILRFCAPLFSCLIRSYPCWPSD